jgi:hypothetical protein
MVNRVCLAESGGIALLIGVPGTDGDFFKEGGGRAFGTGYAVQPHGILDRLEETVYLPSGYGPQLGVYCGGDMEVRRAA